MKRKSFLILILVLVLALAGCSKANEPVKEEEPAGETSEEMNEKVDVVTTASIVNDADALVNGLSESGTWIVATLNDISVDEEIIVAGEFTHRDEIARKLGLYAQDSDRNVTDRYTLEAPMMTVKSENFKLQGGTFKGDVYVEANGFILKDAKIDGNLTFANEDYKKSFVNEGEVTGSIELK